MAVISIRLWKGYSWLRAPPSPSPLPEASPYTFTIYSVKSLFLCTFCQKVLQGARANSTQAVFLLTDGLSNGPNPVPVAVSLKDVGVEVFSFGIRDGYIPELLQMASDKKDEHCYILDSFAEFEALARRALHEGDV